jgi:hypothetical protein
MLSIQFALKEPSMKPLAKAAVLPALALLALSGCEVKVDNQSKANLENTADSVGDTLGNAADAVGNVADSAGQAIENGADAIGNKVGKIDVDVKAGDNKAADNKAADGNKQ